MTKEDLLKPRVKAIADDTSSNYEVGEMFYADERGEFYFYGDEGRWSFNPDNYPHLFKRLEWWEDRDVKDMPEYVKNGENGMPRKVDKYLFLSDGYTIMNFEGGRQRYIGTKWLPATESEYLEFKNSNH